MPYIAMVCAILADIAMVFTVMVYLAMATHIIARVVWPGVVPKFFCIRSHCSSVQFTTPSAAARTSTHTNTRTFAHTSACAHTHIQTHSCMLIIGLYIQVQLPESFGNLSALEELYLNACTGLVHTCHTTCMHTHICTVHIIILWYYLRRQDRRVWPL